MTTDQQRVLDRLQAAASKGDTLAADAAQLVIQLRTELRVAREEAHGDALLAGDEAANEERDRMVAILDERIADAYLRRRLDEVATLEQLLEMT